MSLSPFLQRCFPEDTKNFITSHFNVRKCDKYSEKKKGVCICNKHMNEHGNTTCRHEPWSYENNTVLCPCNTFGYINFQDFDFKPRGHCSKFIRFDFLKNEELTCQNLFNLLVNYGPWNIPQPKLIISINGGLKTMKFISTYHKKNFKQGLINVMKQDQTWVIGNGFNVSIHKILSEAIFEFRIHHENIKDQVTLLGINTWGSVRNNDSLDPTQNFSGKSNSTKIFTYQYPSYSEKGKVILDALYDNFLFCDDGTEKQYDKEMDFRLKFENYIKNKVDGFLVHIIFEGDYKAIDNGFTALQYKVPLVIIKGSGGAANIIADLLELPQKKLKESINDIINVNSKLFEKSRKARKEYIDCLSEMYSRHKRHILVYDIMDNNMKFDKKILEAMIVAAGHSTEKTLQLCLKFNCAKIANKYVFSSTKYLKLSQASIESMFFTAVKENKPEFVNLFIENNFEIENFITKEMLKELYDISLNPEFCQCAELLTDLLKSNKKTYFSSEQDFDLLLAMGKLIQGFSGNILRNCYKNYEDIDECDPLMSINAQYLFLWSLLSGRIELSKIFWRIGKDQIGSALIGSIILRSLAKLIEVRGDNNLGTKLSDGSKKYETLAISILTESYNKSKPKTHQLIIRELKRWNSLTCLQIATNADLLEFLNHGACRSYITNVWKGDLSPYLPIWKILLTIPFSLFLMKILIMPTFPQKAVTEDRNDYGYAVNADQEDSKQNNQYRFIMKRKKSKRISFAKAMVAFYSATIVKFCIYLLSYIFFLMVFIYLNLVELKPLEDVKVLKDVAAEMYVDICVIMYLFEEIKQIYGQKITGFKHKVEEYFSGIWNKMDMIIIFVFFISCIIRFTIPKNYFMICRCCFAISLSMFILRTMQFYFINKSIGPKIIMIRKMLVDIAFFLSIFIIFILAYGTLFHSLKFPNCKFDLTLIQNVFYIPYFQMYGELMLEVFDVSEPCTDTNCYVKKITTILCFAIFLLMTNILLINLLIAMFGYTFNQIQEDSEKLWSFIRILLVQEFYEKHLCPPPFSLYYWIISVIKLIPLGCCKISFREKKNLLSQTLSYDENFILSCFEQFCMDAVLSEQGSQEADKPPEKNTSEKMDSVDHFDNMEMLSESTAPDCPTEILISLQQSIDKRLDAIEKHLNTQCETIKSI